LRQARNDRTKPNIVPPIRKKKEEDLYKKASTIVILLGALKPCS
jgi:hypothetical protein